MPDRLLVTVTGPDRPGITAELSRVLADGGAALLDVEQVVVQGSLTLSFLLEIQGDQSSAVLKDLLFAGKRHGVNVDFEPARPAELQTARERFVVTLLARPIAPSHLQAVATALSGFTGNIDRIEKLSSTDLSALEIRCSLPATGDGVPDALRRAMLDLSTRLGIDVAIQREDVHRKTKRLVVMDMDSTLIRIEVIDELARIAGVGDEVSAITRASMHGEIDFDESLRRRVGLLKGLDASALQQIANDLPLMEGAERLVAMLRRLGYRTAVISGGFDIPANALKDRLGLDWAFSNVLEVEDGRLTGRLVGGIVNAVRKAEILEELAASQRIPLEQTVAIGDGANDMLMLQKAGLGVAFHAKPKLREAADTALSGGLDALLYLLGFSARELERLS